MKIVAVGDIYLKGEYYVNCFASHPEYDLKVVEFGSSDQHEMRHTFHMIERHGPEAMELPAELWEAIEDADVLMVHICHNKASVPKRINPLSHKNRKQNYHRECKCNHQANI